MAFLYTGYENLAEIKIIGVGGAGGSAVNNMINAKLKGVKFIVANTDWEALEASQTEIKIQIGRQLTEGLGAGADPAKGRDAALESADELREALKDSHMVFIVAGFGGGTGTGAAPVIAEICKDLGILTVAVASKPFSFEGKKREKQALEGLKKLHGITDTVITIPNDRLRRIAPKGARMIDMFIKADEILHHSVKAITDLIMMPGHVTLDFADVRTTMQKGGKALMGIGNASGENRAVEAAERAISHPLLEDISISGAKTVLMNITSSSDLTLDEITKASDRIYNQVGDDTEIIWGHIFDEELGDDIRITVIAMGFVPEGSEVPAKEIIFDNLLGAETRTMKKFLVDGSVVAQLRALQPDPKTIPETLMRKRPIRTAADFDPNLYFTVLTHLKMEEGFTLDYVYHYIEGFGGNPCLYARPTGLEPFDTFFEYRDWAETKNLQSFLVADGTPDGFFQLSVFDHLARQFYLSWHANYDDKEIITSTDDSATLVKTLNGENFGAKLTEDQSSSIMAIPPEPFVTMTENNAEVSFCVFTKWDGYHRLKETFRRSPPHWIVGRDVLDAVKYDCGVCY